MPGDPDSGAIKVKREAVEDSSGLRSPRGCYEVASLMILAVMRMAKAMKWMPLSVFGSRS